jgi:hypothetical protein
LYERINNNGTSTQGDGSGLRYSRSSPSLSGAYLLFSNTPSSSIIAVSFLREKKWRRV